MRALAWNLTAVLPDRLAGGDVVREATEDRRLPHRDLLEGRLHPRVIPLVIKRAP